VVLQDLLGRAAEAKLASILPAGQPTLLFLVSSFSPCTFNAPIQLILSIEQQTNVTTSPTHFNTNLGIPRKIILAGVWSSPQKCTIARLGYCAVGTHESCVATLLW
jgi:hypothetical protein